MEVCGNGCCATAIIKDSGVLSLGVLKYVCVRGVMDVVFSVCIVVRGAAGARVWEILVFRHADAVCLCLVCILWHFSLLHSA